MLTSDKIGIRLSLVNRDNPQEILSVQNDGITPRVVDILYVDKATFLRQTKGQLINNEFILILGIDISSKMVL